VLTGYGGAKRAREPVLGVQCCWPFSLDTAPNVPDNPPRVADSGRNTGDRAIGGSTPDVSGAPRSDSGRSVDETGRPTTPLIRPIVQGLPHRLRPRPLPRLVGLREVRQPDGPPSWEVAKHEQAHCSEHNTELARARNGHSATRQSGPDSNVDRMPEPFWPFDRNSRHSCRRLSAQRALRQELP
jgi:hypothetical protein